MSYSIQTSTLYPNTPFPERGGQLQAISGYIFNPSNNVPATVIIRGINNSGKFTRTIDPLSYLNFSSLEFEQMIVTSTENLDIVYSENISFSLTETTSSPDTTVNQLFTTNIRNLTTSDQPLISGTIKNPNSITGTFTGGTGTVISPPAGVSWKLRSIILTWTAEATGTVYPQIQISPTAIPTALAESVLNLVFISLSVTANDVYAVDCAEYVQTKSSSLVFSYYLSEQNIPNDFYVFSNESIRMLVNDEGATITYYISYFTENIG